MTDLYVQLEKLYCSSKTKHKDDWQLSFYKYFLPLDNFPDEYTTKSNAVAIPNSNENVDTPASNADSVPHSCMDFMDDLVFLVSKSPLLSTSSSTSSSSPPTNNGLMSASCTKSPHSAAKNHHHQCICDDEDEDDDMSKLGQPHVQVMRRAQCRRKLLPSSRTNEGNYADGIHNAIHWKCTFYLNIVVQYIQYNLIVGICEQNSNMTGLRLLRRFDKKMYASPTRRRLDTKGQHEEVTYPCIYFMLDTFDEMMEQCHLHPTELFYVELVASDPQQKRVSSLFRRFVKYETLNTVLADAKMSRTTRNQSDRRRTTSGTDSPGGPEYQCTEPHFFPCLGTEGKGCVELVVRKSSPLPNRPVSFRSKILPNSAATTLSRASFRQRRDTTESITTPETATTTRFGLSGVGSLFSRNKTATSDSCPTVRKSRSDIFLRNTHDDVSSEAASGPTALNRMLDNAWSWLTSSVYEPKETSSKSELASGTDEEDEAEEDGETCKPVVLMPQSPFISLAITYFSASCEDILTDFFHLKRPPKLRPHE